MQKKILSLFLILVMIGSLCLPVSAISNNNKRELIRYIYLNALSQAKEEINTEELLLDTLMQFAGESDEDYNKVLTYFTRSIDEYGDYFSPEYMDEIDTDLTGQSGGIGSGVEMRNGVIYVVNIIPDSPSEKAGVQVGHAIVKANGISLEGMSMNEALSYIRGEPGTEVTITFEDFWGEQYDILLVRDIIEISSVNYSILTDYPQIGYAEITNFTTTTGAEMKDAIHNMKNQGMKQLILDLRYNGGGVLEAAVEVAGLFLEPGKKVLIVEPRNEAEKEEYFASGKLFDGDLVILVNEYSASASEIVTGALKTHQRATVIGETTYGKGTVQMLYPLPVYGGYFKFTTAHYLMPDGTSINKTGISPNITVSNETFHLTEEEIPTFHFLRVMRIGDTGEDVKNMKEALNQLNYSLNDTDVFDEETFRAVKTFQKRSQLYPYGVCDFTTQQHIKQTLLDTLFYEDTQLNQAITYLSE